TIVKTKYHHRFPLSAHSSSILYMFGKAPLFPGTLVASRRFCTACWASAGAKVGRRYPPATKTLQPCVRRCQVQQMHGLALRRPSNDAKRNIKRVIRSRAGSRGEE